MPSLKEIFTDPVKILLAVVAILAILAIAAQPPKKSASQANMMPDIPMAKEVVIK